MKNEKGRIQKGELERRNESDGTHLTPSPSPQSREGRKHETRNAGQIPNWWLEVPDAEKAVIRDVLTAIRGLKGSRSPLVGHAARKWERSIACFIKFRLMGGASRTGRRLKSKGLSLKPRAESRGSRANWK